MITLTIIAGGLALGAAAVAWAGSRRTAAEPMDVERQERWLVAHSPQWLRGAMRGADRRVAGGAAVAVGLVSVTLGAAVVGWILDTVDSSRGLARWDKAAAQYGADHIADPTWLERITRLGSSPVAIAALCGAALIDMTVRRRRHKDVLLYAAVVGVGILAVNNLLKWLVDRPRPDLNRFGDPVGSSFPSGHSAMSAAAWLGVAFILTRGRSRPVRLAATFAAVAVAGVVATTRVLLGVHWLTDVVAGLLVGWTWWTVSTLAFGGRIMRIGEPATRLARAATQAVGARS